ncbi:MAG: UDP-glucose 4-epimerase GalE [Candidatus Nanoarchaeia archaeon]|nr:UDP-glucose 4-epimerase GalE [Candidatus Nanoarchaeia archaeon]
MKLLVTGGAGYIGSHIVHLLYNKHEIIVLDSLVHGHEKSIPKEVNLVRGCLSDTALLDKLFSENGFDAVVHLAGFIEAGESMQKPEKYFQNNTVNGFNLLNAMIKHNVKKIVYASTAAVYGQPKEIPIAEDAEKIPANYYGLSKLMFENMLDACKVHGIKNISLRFFNASGAGFGIGEHHEPETHLIPLILQVPLGKRDCIKLFGTDYPTEDGTCVRDYIHVLDIAKAHELALNALEKGKEGKFNLGSGRGYSVKEVIDAARVITNHPIPVKEEQRRAGDPAVLVASNRKAFEELGWNPEYGLKEIVLSAWEWHRNNPEGFKN